MQVVGDATEYYGCRGQIEEIAKNGYIVVRLGVSNWKASFHPHDLDYDDDLAFHQRYGVPLD